MLATVNVSFFLELEAANAKVDCSLHSSVVMCSLCNGTLPILAAAIFFAPDLSYFFLEELML